MQNIRKIITERLENAINDYQLIAGGKVKNILSGQINAYQDCLNLIPAPRTEQEILNDFEKLGYINVSVKGFRTPHIRLRIYENDTHYDIVINKESKLYSKHHTENFKTYPFTMLEHKLLNELFICWGWL